MFQFNTFTVSNILFSLILITGMIVIPTIRVRHSIANP